MLLIVNSYFSKSSWTIDNRELNIGSLNELFSDNLIEYSKLMAQLSQKLSRLLNLEETVNKIECN